MQRSIKKFSPEVSRIEVIISFFVRFWKWNLTTSLLVLGFLVLNPILGQATILTVSQDEGRIPAQYTTISSALSVANSGDTIYVHPSVNSYAYFDLNKSVVLVAPGHSPHSQMYGDIVSTSFKTLPGGSGSTIIGFNITSLSNYNAGSLSNVNFLRCKIATISYQHDKLENLLFDGCVFTSSLRFGNNMNSSIIIRNSVFQSSARFDRTIKNDVYIINNVFLGDPNGDLSNVVNDTHHIRNVVWLNNIFYGRNFDSNFVKYSTFANNVFYHSGVTNTVESYVSNSEENNFANNYFPTEAPQFLAYTSTGEFKYDDDYRLSGSDPNFDNGSGGSRMGLLDNFNKYGRPFNPLIQNLVVATPVVLQDGKLEIHVTAESAVEDSRD